LSTKGQNLRPGPHSPKYKKGGSWTAFIVLGLDRLNGRGAAFRLRRGTGYPGGQTKGEWRVISYGNTLHGFTNPAVDGSMLRKRALQCAGRSLLLSSMRGLFDEVLA
jgi:hypothetical protein